MRRQSAFEIYLRTGRVRIASADRVELKFNPWHDEEDGRFTFAGQGQFFGRGSRSNERNSASGIRAGDGSFGGGGASGSFGPDSSTAGKTGRNRARNRASSRDAKFSPTNPRNYSLHAVKRGETLSSIAATRKGITSADLAWLNDIPLNRPLQIGQRLKVPNQSYLDAATARQKFAALSLYMDTHGGRLPPNVANPPSIETQIEAAGVRTITSNNYNFDVDMLDRPRRIAGELQLKAERRSKREQANAGKPDRRPDDDGGHYIAARFNGPRERFNHFAQNRSFNRGAYRAIEDKWAAALAAGKRVFVEIVPQYEGLSRRPHSLRVVWFIDGERHSEAFPNEEKGK